MKRFLLFILLFSVSVLLSCSGKDSPKQPRAEGGILDCRSWSFAKNGPVRLEGEWEFYWGRILDAETIDSSFNGAQKSYIDIPSVWTSKVQGHKALPVRGEATYRVKVLLPGGIRDKLAIQIPAVDTAFQIYVHGQPLYSNTTSSYAYIGSEPIYYAPVTRGIEAAQSAEIIVTMSNLNYPRPGMRDCFTIGCRKTIESAAETKLVTEIFLIGSILLMAVYHIGIFFFRRSDRSSLYFALLCITAAVRLAVTGQGYAYRFSWCTWRLGTALEYLTFYWCAGFFSFYIRSLYPKEIHRFLIWTIIPVNTVFSLIVIITPILFYANTLVFYDIYIGLGIIYITFAVTLALLRKREDAGILMAGILIFFASIINDLLFNYRIIHTSFILPYGFYIFFFAQSFILLRHYSRAFAHAEVLSLKLEKEVSERTQELEIEHDQLEKEKSSLEKEIRRAEQLHDMLFPLNPPAEKISFFCKSTPGVGGDFFDFIPFDGGERIGIFVSDVSGRGVPTVLVTLLLKSAIHQSGDRKEDPASFLSYVNDLLAGTPGGYFCTAFYGIYNFKDRTLLFSNAGHERPYIISETTISKVTGAASIPAGAFDGIEISQNNKNYITGRITLPENGKFVIFTDGLSDSRSEDGEEFFSERCDLPSLFQRLKDQPGPLFIRNVYKSLVEFHGSDQFEDDISIICIDT